MRILAIETSCDETAIAIAEFSGSKAKPKIRVLSHILALQTKVHAKFGGVVPNLARREHQKNLAPILLEALEEARLLESRITNHESRKKNQKSHDSCFIILDSILAREPELLTRFKKHILPLPVPEIDAIAVTHGPGLEPALWVGVNFARALAVLWGKPLIPVNHMAGHIYSALLQTAQENPKHEIRNPKQIRMSKSKIQNRFESRISNLEFPAIALLVSGGHTQLVLMKGHGKYQMLGETRDDAAGEAFDKVARLLGLGGIQGGPAISALAEEIQNAKFKMPESRRLPGGSPEPKASGRWQDDNAKFKIKLPRPMLHSGDYDFSFSGLKTAVLYMVRELEKTYSIKKLQPLIAKEFQDAAVEVLVKKTVRAAGEYKVKTVLLGGGVAANKLLRETLGKTIGQNLPNAKYLIPDPTMTGDNALMIAIAAFFAGKKAKPAEMRAEANLPLW